MISHETLKNQQDFPLKSSFLRFTTQNFFPFFFSLYIQLWKESNVNVIVYGVKHKEEKDYFTHLGCPIIVDNVKKMIQNN